MRKPRGFQQKGERRIAAALRIALAAVLLVLQILFVLLTTHYLKDHFALIYGALEIVALITTLLILALPAAAGAQGGAFGPLPPADEFRSALARDCSGRR